MTTRPPTLLKVLTWNVDDGGIWVDAPRYHRINSKRQAIVRRITRHAPDIVALQEVHDLDYWDKALSQHRYRCVGGVRSHNGKTTLFLGERCVCLKDKGVGPSICAEVQLAGARTDLLVAGCRLAPYEENADTRLQQLERITEAAAAWTPHPSRPQQGPAAVPATQTTDFRLPQQDTGSSSGDLNHSSVGDSHRRRQRKLSSPARPSAQGRAPGQQQAINSAPYASLQGQLPLLVVGDINMREAETAAVTGPAGLGFTSAYQATQEYLLRLLTRRNWHSLGCAEYYTEHAILSNRVFFKGAEWGRVREFGLVGHIAETQWMGDEVEPFYLTDDPGIVTTLEVHLG